MTLRGVAKYIWVVTSFRFCMFDWPVKWNVWKSSGDCGSPLPTVVQVSSAWRGGWSCNDPFFVGDSTSCKHLNELSKKTPKTAKNKCPGLLSTFLGDVWLDAKIHPPTRFANWTLFTAELWRYLLSSNLTWLQRKERRRLASQAVINEVSRLDALFPSQLMCLHSESDASNGYAYLFQLNEEIDPPLPPPPKYLLFTDFTVEGRCSCADVMTEAFFMFGSFWREGFDDSGWFANGAKQSGAGESKWEASLQIYKWCWDSSWAPTSVWEIKYRGSRCSQITSGVILLFFLYFTLPLAAGVVLKKRIKVVNMF